jgi:hypothetical protein
LPPLRRTCHPPLPWQRPSPVLSSSPSRVSLSSATARDQRGIGRRGRSVALRGHHVKSRTYDFPRGNTLQLRRFVVLVAQKSNRTRAGEGIGRRDVTHAQDPVGTARSAKPSTPTRLPFRRGMRPSCGTSRAAGERAIPR